MATGRDSPIQYPDDPYVPGKSGTPAPSTPKPWEFDFTKPQGKELKEKGLEFAGIDPAALNQQIAIAGQQQRQANVNSYNSAVASQRGANPTAVLTNMGQNLAGANAQTGQNVQNLQAQTNFGAQQSNQQALLDYYRTLTGANASKYAADQSADSANMALLAQFLGGAAGGLATAFSDEDLKEPVDAYHRHLLGEHEQSPGTGQEMMAKEGPKSTENFMNSLKPQAFEYKSGTAADDGGKPHVGVMAQDLEKTPQGKSAVVDSPEGKMVDTKQLSMMLAAAMGDLHMRLSKLEGRGHG